MIDITAPCEPQPSYGGTAPRILSLRHYAPDALLQVPPPNRGIGGSGSRSEHCGEASERIT
jgi:hypothetical protein